MHTYGILVPTVPEAAFVSGAAVAEVAVHDGTVVAMTLLGIRTHMPCGEHVQPRSCDHGLRHNQRHNGTAPLID